MPKKKNAIVADGGADDVSIGFPEKWLKKISHWIDTANAMSEEDLKKSIVECEGNIYTIEKEKEASVEIKAAKDVLKEVGGPFRDAKTVQTAKIKYALYLLENRGMNLDNQEEQE